MELKELVASLAWEHRETERTLGDALAELAAQSKVTDAKLAEAFAGMKEASADTDRKLAETFASMREASAETDRKLAEVFAGMREESAETDRQLRRLEGSVGMQFGRFVEALVEPSCLKLFQQRGIVVNQSMRRVEALVEGQQLEIDVLLINGSDVVLVEVKSACRVQDVEDVLEDLKRFRKGFPLYAKHRLYGAVAALEYRAESARYAARKGLFVLKSAGELMEIANPLNFRAKQF